MIIYDNDKTVFKGTKIQLMTETILLLRMAVEKGIFSKFDIELIAEGASLSDEEWSNEFKKYYKILDLTYFAWEGEAKEARRLFTLERI